MPRLGCDSNPKSRTHRKNQTHSSHPHIFRLNFKTRPFVSNLALVLAALSLALLTACGKMQFSKLPSLQLPDPPGGGGGGGTIPSDQVVDVILSLHTDNSPSDGETADIVLVKALNKSGNPVSGYTPSLSVPSGVTYSCLSSNMDGVSVCFFKTKSPGTIDITVTDTLAAASSTKRISVRFNSTRPPRTGYAVAGGSTVVSSGPGVVTVSTVGEATTPIVLNDQDTGILRLLSNMIGAAFDF